MLIKFLLLNNNWKTTSKLDQRTYRFGNIDHGCTVLGFACSISGCLRNERPELIGVDCWAELMVSLKMEGSHTALAVVSKVAE